MNLWIVTIGSSDVQLDSDKVNRDKGRTDKQRSDKVWQYWYDDTIKSECYDIAFEPKPFFKDLEESYRIAPRILGIVYESSDDKTKEEIWNYLTFPLLNTFVDEFNKLQPPEAIAILLTDQSEFFKDSNSRKHKSPYWQDTCKLEPILDRYFQQIFPRVAISHLKLFPQKEAGLDDWDSVLNLVRNQLETIQLEPDTVYVSHQAGTPAISSAVQFMSLARFRKNVKFLVSNEYSQQTRKISPSTYLGAIQRQEAKALLERHDYAGVKLLVNDSLNAETKILLDAAIKWNFAKFDEFASEIQNLSNQTFAQQVSERSQHWWWTGYEAAYLGVIRLRQGNTVEALFHSFRAVEGLIKKWALEEYKRQIKYSHPKQPNTPYIHDIDLPEKIKHWFKANTKKYPNVGLFGKPLFTLLKASYPGEVWDKNNGIQVVANDTIDERNSTFHSLRGLQEKEVFDAWKTDSLEKWKSRVLNCLNFVSQQEFDSLESASLMASVHQELVNAIATWQT